MKWKFSITLIVTAGLILALQAGIDAGKKELEKEIDRPFVPPHPKGVRAVSLGYHTLVADMYWLQAIQHVATSVNQGKVPDDLYFMADFITDLDPKFEIAYYFTGINLLLEGGKNENIIKILKKGKENVPGEWEMPFYLGFTYYFKMQEHEKAAENMGEACELKKVGYYCSLAARIRADQGSPDLGIRLLQEMYKQTDDERAKKTYEKRIRELMAQKQLINMNNALEQYVEKTGESPESISELVRQGFLRGIPSPPLEGYKYIYDSDKDEIMIDPPLHFGVFELPKKKKQKSLKKAPVEK